MVHTRANERDRGSWATKVDALEALACVLFLMPLFAAVYFLVKLDGGPALVAIERQLSDGTTLRTWRFRTTIPGLPLRAGAPSFTRLGALLHKYRLDQLPEFAAVIRGEMTLNELLR